MKKLNKKGVTIVETVMTFVLVMIISTGLLTIIMNYRQKVNIEMKRLELVTFKNMITKEIQTDINEYGLYEINYGGACSSATTEFSSCANLVFKNGVEKILAVSQINTNDKNLLNNKYIQYGDEKHMIEDKLPEKIPTGREAKDVQNLYISSEDFLTSDTIILKDGSVVNIYSIDIYMEHIDYDDDYGIHIVATNNDTLSTSTSIQDFAYTNNVTVYTVPVNGTYRLELWGASGGNKNTYKGGLGSYVSGYIYLKKGTKLYLYIGGQGVENSPTGGYNGGSSLATDGQKYGSPGGGATDIRLVGGNWDDFNSLKSRIIVAAGGGGANNRNITMNNTANIDGTNYIYGAGDGGAGGGLYGIDGVAVNYKQDGYTTYNQHSIGTGARQNRGGLTNVYDSNKTLTSRSVTGNFGKSTNTNQSGGGGGWFTGGNSSHGGAGGGSSYISGHEGCLAIDQNSTSSSITMKSDSVYQNYRFGGTIMIDGNGYSWTTQRQNQVTMPSYQGKTTDVGNKGNGHIRITYLGL